MEKNLTSSTTFFRFISLFCALAFSRTFFELAERFLWGRPVVVEGRAILPTRCELGWIQYKEKRIPFAAVLSDPLEACFDLKDLLIWEQ